MEKNSTALPLTTTSPEDPGPRTLPKIWTEDGVARVEVAYDGQVRDIFGTDSKPFCTTMIESCLSVSGTGDPELKNGQAALAIVAEIAPNDAVEAMLASQMAAVHILMMRYSSLLTTADPIQTVDVYERVFNKLARTFTAQTEALRKHRSGGKQTMTVEHITVNSGGQAMVGNVQKTGGG